MSLRRVGLGAGTVLLALLLQGSIVERLPLPGAPPDLVLVLVVAFALVEGSSSGAVTGFLAGLLVDLDAGHELGRVALVYALVGYLAGQPASGGPSYGGPSYGTRFPGARSSGVRSTGVRPSRGLPILVMASAAALGVSVYAAEGLLLGDPRITGEAYARAMIGTVPYCAALIPVVLPVVGVLARRVDREQVRR